MRKMIQFECRKIFSRRLSVIAFIVVAAFSILLTMITYKGMYASDGTTDGKGRTAVEIDKKIADKYEGKLTDEKVKQILTEFAPKVDLHGMNAQYLYLNAIQSAAVSRFADANGEWNGATVSDVFGNAEIKVGYINGWLNTSQNNAKIFIALAFVIIIMLAPVFSGEYNGMDNIVLTSKYGKTKCATAKVIAGIISATVVTAMITILNMALAFIFYGTDGLDCSILFSSNDFVEGYIPFNISCGTVLKYQILLAFAGAISIAGITLFFSAVCKNEIISLVVSAAIYIVPIMLPISENSPLFRYVVLLPIYCAQYISIMSIEQMDNGMLYAIWVVPVAITFLLLGSILSRKIFAKHQVS